MRSYSQAELCLLLLYALPGEKALRESLYRRLFRALEQQDGENALEGYTETFYTLTQEGTDSLSDYLVDQLRYGISSYAQAAAHGQAGVVLT